MYSIVHGSSLAIWLAVAVIPHAVVTLQLPFEGIEVGNDVFADSTQGKVVTCQAKSTTGTVDFRECGTAGADNYAATIGCAAANLSNSSRLQVAKPQRSNRTYVFLLGFPFTGTSAVHFLLGTSPHVSTLADPKMLGPKKEGWAQKFGPHAGKLANKSFKSRMVGKRWEIEDNEIPWKKLDELYHEKWNLSKPILLENSPPEVLHSEKLYEEFSPHGEVRFIVLTRSPCNRGHHVEKYLREMEQLRWITKRFGQQVFVLRYEDVCTDTQQLAKALDAWLPGLGRMDDSAVPSLLWARRPAHTHESLPIPTYCKEYGLPEWPYKSTLRYENHTRKRVNHLLHFFGYSVRSL